MLRPSSLIPWPLGNSNRIYPCGMSIRTQKILKSHHYMLHGFKFYLKSGKMGSQRLNSSPHGWALSCNTSYPHSSHGSRTWLLDSLFMSQTVEENRREDIQSTCEPLGDLKYLLRTTNECHSNEHPQNQVSGDKISLDSTKAPMQLGRGCTPK